MKTCISLQRRFLQKLVYDDSSHSQTADNHNSLVPDASFRKRLLLSKEPLHSFILRQSHIRNQTSNGMGTTLDRVGKIIFDKGVTVDIDKEVLRKEAVVSHHVTIKSLLKGSIIERFAST